MGAEPEKEVEVKVTFPEDYHAEELKGKDAVFKCTVHEIKTKEVPEIDDEFASEVSDFDTLDEYKADLETKLKEQKEKDAREQKEDQAVEKVVANASMEIPDAMIDEHICMMMNEFAQSLQYQGATLEQYSQITGMTTEKMQEEMRPQAVKRIESRLVLEAVVKAENMETSDEKLEEELAKMAENYHMEADKLKGLMGEEELKQMKMDIAVQEAITLLADNAVEK